MTKLEKLDEWLHNGFNRELGSLGDIMDKVGELIKEEKKEYMDGNNNIKYEDYAGTKGDRLACPECGCRNLDEVWLCTCGEFDVECDKVEHCEDATNIDKRSACTDRVLGLKCLRKGCGNTWRD